MRFGGFLLGAFVGATFALFMNEPLWLFSRFGFVLPAAFAVYGAFAVRRVPGGRGLAGAGYAAGATTMIGILLVAGVVCWWILSSLMTRHGWF
ncbi:MAG: hypothetical protein ABR567_22820 [Myxococcales bacterium]|nr:hypothetical protein [Myxococcales bacterium]